MPNVLYIDDNEDLLDLGKKFLERSGDLRVDTAVSVPDALDRLKHRHYDGIISDYQMPVMNGIEVLRYIRTNYKDLPFILFTGRGREEVVIEALNNGADFYLQKGGEQKAQFIELEHKVKKAIDQKRMRDTLKESQQRMADIINFLPDAMFAINLEHKVIAWNRSIENLTGISRDSIIGKGDYAYAVALTGQKKQVLVDLVLNTEEEITKSYPQTIIQGDQLVSEIWNPTLNQGKGAYLWLVASPLYDTAGNVIGAIEAIRDITVRKEAEEKLKLANENLQAAYEQLTASEEELRSNYEDLGRNEQALRESEERYRNVVEDQTEFICRFSPDGRLSFVNDAYCRYFGLDRATCIGKQHTVVIPSEDLWRMKKHLAALSPENPAGIVEHRITMPSGDIRWQRWSDRAIFNPNGNLVEYQSVGRDVTERVEAEEKLKYVHDELGAAYEQLTATEEELRQNYEELGRNEQALRESEERYRNVVEDQTEFICRFTPDGRLSFVNDAYCRYFGLDRATCIGKQHTVVIPQEDRRQLKKHLAALSPENPAGIVEHRIIMPSGDIRWQRWNDRAIFDRSGRRLEYQSVGRDITDHILLDKALNESNKKLNLLSSITRHDILNQLTALQGYLELSEIKVSDPEVKNWMKKAWQTSDVIRDQILFTRHYQNLGIHNALWQRVFACATRVCLDDGFSKVSVDPQLKEVEIFADPLLKTVFHNLFENAEMHGGEVTKINISGHTSRGGFDIIIEDNGTGIRPEEKKKIFQKGFGRHTGLGLFLAQEVLAITGLSIRESGKFGEGARFIIHVPKGMFRLPGAQTWGYAPQSSSCAGKPVQ